MKETRTNVRDDRFTKKKKEAELEISESQPGFTQTLNLIQPFDEPLTKQNNGSQFIEQAWTESNGSEKGKFYLRTQHLFTRILLYVFILSLHQRMLRVQRVQTYDQWPYIHMCVCETM